MLARSTNGWHVLIIILILASTIFVVSQLNRSPLDKQRDTIQVSGTSDLSVKPDQAEIILAIQTDAGQADTAQVRNKALAAEVIKSLKANGIDEDDIETQSFTLQKKERYDPQRNEIVVEGYTVSNTLKITTQDLENVGKVVDSAIAAGANRVDNIQFTLSKDAQQEANAEALEEASENAEKKARALAKSLGVKIGKAISVSETNYIFQPYFADFKMGTAEGAPMADTAIIPPKDVTIRLNVNVIFEIY